MPISRALAARLGRICERANAALQKKRLALWEAASYRKNRA
jgi:hypothetical protein